MLVWRIAIQEIGAFGIPYAIPLEADSRGTGDPSAFVLKVAEPVGGSMPAWDEPGGHLIAFGNACTHMGCSLVSELGRESPQIAYSPPAEGQEQSIVCGPCPCHGTTFDLSKEGLVVLGPATQDLPQLALERDGDDVIATGWRAAPDPRIERWPLPPAAEAE